MPDNLALTGALNKRAGTSGLDAVGAANALAGTKGLDLLGALNVKAGTKGLDLQGVCNKIAGTNGLSAQAALGVYLPNLLSNGGFETGSTVATSWASEGTTSIAPTYSLSTIGVTGGTKSQRIAYTGQAADSAKVLAIYQAPITASQGEKFRFGIDVSGTLTNCVGIIGIEHFTPPNIYAGESDTYITNISATPKRFTVEHVCGANTTYVAAFIQVNEIYANAVIQLYLDSAVMQKITSL